MSNKGKPADRPKANSVNVGDAVKIIGGKHEGEAGKLVHVRRATEQAHVETDKGVRVVGIKEIAAA
jgi:ribosomal protein L24